jgi:hypothetical protein
LVVSFIYLSYIGIAMGLISFTLKALIQVAYFVCIGLWLSMFLMIFGILLRLTYVFSPFGTKFMMAAPKVMFLSFDDD